MGGFCISVETLPSRSLKTPLSQVEYVEVPFKQCPINCRQVLKDHNLKETLQRLVLERQNSDSPQTWDFWPLYDD